MVVLRTRCSCSDAYETYSIKTSIGTSTRQAETGSADEGLQELRETTNNGQILSIAGTYYFKDAIGAGLYLSQWYDIGGEARVTLGDQRFNADMNETIIFIGAFATARTGSTESFARYFGIAGLGLASLTSETVFPSGYGNDQAKDLITTADGSTLGFLMGGGAQLSIYKNLSGVIEAEYMYANIGELEVSTNIEGFNSSTIKDYSLSYWAVKLGLQYEF